MKLVVDMNLSTEWLPFLRRAGWQVQHWQDIGAETAEDDEILGWARTHQTVVFPQDLDRTIAACQRGGRAECHSPAHPR